MLLAHCSLGSVYNIIYQLFTVWQRNIATVDIFRFLLIYKKQVIPAFTPGYVDIFPDLDISIGTENG